MSRPVALPMYAASPEALDAFWQGLRGHMRHEGVRDLPVSLDVPDDLDAHWRAPDLLLSQTCGYPLTTRLADRVRYVGTPCYRARGCEGPLYRSLVMVRADAAAHDLAGMRGRRAAFNGRDSQSGYNALRALVAPLATDGRFFAEAIETGAHRMSALAVQRGAADVAAIDAVTYALLQRDEPETVQGLRVLGVTEPAPGLPLITSSATTPEDLTRLRSAVAVACRDPALAEARAALLFDGFDVLAPDAYAVIPAMQERAARLGYPTLA